MQLTYVYHIRTGSKSYYRNTEKIDESQYHELVKNTKQYKLSFISDLTKYPPPEGYPDNIYDLFYYLNQFTCVKNRSNQSIAYKDESQWEKDIFP